MRKKEFHARIWSRLVTFARGRKLLSSGDRVLVAFSGGPDSVCLLHFLREMGRKTGFEIFACHVNHGIRGSAARRDEKFALGLCAELGVKCVSVKSSAPRAAKAARLSVEHAARKVRYAALEKIARKFKCKKIALGHHLDDNAETMLLNLLRGTNPRGLAGMPVVRRLNEKSPLVLIRPLMAVTRAEVLEYLRQHGLRYVTDETNEDEDYTRNWVRKTLLALIETKQPRFREHLLKFAESLNTIIRLSVRK